MVVNAIRGMTTIDPRVNDLMATISAPRWDVLSKVQLPNAVPYIFAGLKVAVPLSIIGAVVGGLTLGMVESLVIVGVSSGYKDALTFSVLIVIMIFMPHGILGRGGRGGG